jgi:hypothetical protein
LQHHAAVIPSDFYDANEVPPLKSATGSKPPNAAPGCGAICAAIFGLHYAIPLAHHEALLVAALLV